MGPYQVCTSVMERGGLQLYGTIQDAKNTSLGGGSWFRLETEDCFFLRK